MATMTWAVLRTRIKRMASRSTDDDDELLLECANLAQMEILDEIRNSSKWAQMCITSNVLTVEPAMFPADLITTIGGGTKIRSIAAIVGCEDADGTKPIPLRIITAEQAAAFQVDGTRTVYGQNMHRFARVHFDSYFRMTMTPTPLSTVYFRVIYMKDVDEMENDASLIMGSTAIGYTFRQSMIYGTLWQYHLATGRTESHAKRWEGVFRESLSKGIRMMRHRGYPDGVKEAPGGF